MARSLGLLLGVLHLPGAGASDVRVQYQAQPPQYLSAPRDGWMDVHEDFPQHLEDTGSTWLKAVLASAASSSGQSQSGYMPEAISEATMGTTTSTAAVFAEEEQSEQLALGSTQPEEAVGPLVAAAISGGVPDEVKAASDSGIQIFKGMLQTFLHRGELTDQELECLDSEMQDAGRVAYNTSKDIAHLFSELLLPLSQKMDSMDSMDIEAKTLVSTEMTSLDLLALIPKLSQRMQNLVDSFDGFVDNCHAGAMKDALRKVRQHMGNLQYVAGHLQASSADVMKELSRANEDFLQEDFTSFGQELGRVFRKVLLTGDGASLPEGPPSAKEMSKLSTGLLEGFFGRGFKLDLSGEYFPDEPVEAVLDEDEAERALDHGEPLRLHIDLHKCIEKDQKYFEGLMLGVYMLFSQMDLGVLTPDQMLAMPGLMINGLKGLPRALERCGMGPKPGEMLLDALQAAASDHLSLNVSAPSQASRQQESVSQLADEAAKDWQHLEYFHLGEDLGKIMREMVFQGFPELYSVDELSGRLQRRLPGGSHVGFALIFLAPTLLLALLLVRRRREAAPHYLGLAHPEHSEVDECAA